MNVQDILNTNRKALGPEDGTKILLSNGHFFIPKNTIRSIKNFLENRMLEIKKIIMYEYFFSGSFFTGVTKCKHKRNIDH